MSKGIERSDHHGAVAIVTVDATRRALARDPRGVTVVDARPYAEFARGHIPGALSLEWEHWCAAPPAHAAPALSQPGYWGTLAASDTTWYAERLSRRGLSSDRPIVVYADGLRSKGREGRIAWMLLYLGARHVALLDGGWSEWLQQGGATCLDMIAAPPGRFTVALNEPRRWMQDRLAQAYAEGRLPTLVDTRTEAEYTGACYDYLPRKGRLPGAVLWPFPALFDGAHRFARRATYLARLPAALQRPAGAGGSHDPARRVVTYCEVGVRASLAALLHEAYTGEVVGVFDGSLIEWALHAHLPVDGPATP